MNLTEDNKNLARQAVREAVQLRIGDLFRTFLREKDGEVPITKFEDDLKYVLTRYSFAVQTINGDNQ